MVGLINDTSNAIFRKIPYGGYSQIRSHMQISDLDTSVNACIIESVDTISRDGPDTPIYVIHYKEPNYFIQVRSLVYFASWL